MTYYARRFELRVHKRGTTTPTDATVDFTLASEIADLTVIPGPVARPLDGRTETQTWTIPVVDAGGAITSRLADEGGYPRLLGRLVEVQEWNGETWATVYTGRIAGLSEATPGKYDVRLADERWVERRATVFTRADTTTIYPLGIRYVWRRGARFIRDGVGWTVTRLPLIGQPQKQVRLRADASAIGVTTMLTQQAVDLIRGDAVDNPSHAREGGNFRTLRLHLNGKDYEVISFDTRRAGSFDAPSITLTESLVPGEPLRDVWVVWPDDVPEPAEGARFTGYLYAPGHEPTTALPLHVGVQDPAHEWGALAGESGLHPFTLARRVYEAAGVRYDPAAFAVLEADPSYGRVTHRITARQDVAAWLEQHVYKPTLTLPFVDNLGRISPKPLTPPAGLDPNTLFIFDASNTKAPYPTWDHQDGEMVNVVGAEYEADRLTPPGAEPSEYQALDGLYTERIEREPLKGATVAHMPERSMTLDPSGWQTGASPAPLPDPITGVTVGSISLGDIAVGLRHALVASHIFDRFSFGPIIQLLYGTEDTASVQAGDWVLIDQDSLQGPNPATNARSGKRLVQVMKRDRLPIGYRFEVLDGGPALQPLAAPTVSVALDTDDPRHAIVVTVSGVPTGATATVEVAYDAAFTRIAHTLTGLANGAHTVRPLASGSEVHVRAQSTQPGRTRSVWSQTKTVTTTALPAPTGLVATPSGRTIRLDWTPGADGYALLPTLGGNPVLPSPLPAGSDSYVFAGLPANTSVQVGVRHVDPWGGAGPIASLTATTGTSQTLAAPRRFTVLQGRADPARPTGLFGGLDLVRLGIEVGFVAVERFAAHRVQVSTDPSFAGAPIELMVPPGRETARIPTPLITSRLYARTRAEAEGWEPSPWSSIVSAYATALSADTPASDNFPGGWADMRVSTDGSVAVTLGSDDADTDRVYYAVSTTGFPEVDETSDYVARDALPATVDPGLVLAPDEVAYLTVRYWSSVSGFGQSLRRSIAWPQGPDGRYRDYRFQVAATQPATPTGENPSGWFDAPPSVPAGQYLWMTTAWKKADGTLDGSWSTPVRLTGEKGDPGSSDMLVLDTRWRPGAGALSLDLLVDYGADWRSLRIQYTYPSTPGGLPDTAVNYTVNLGAGGGHLTHQVEDENGLVRFWPIQDPAPTLTITPYTETNGSGSAGTARTVTPEAPGETGMVGGRVALSTDPTSAVQGDRVIFAAPSGGLGFHVTQDAAGRPLVQIAGNVGPSIPEPTDGALIVGGPDLSYYTLAPQSPGQVLLLDADRRPTWAPVPLAPHGLTGHLDVTIASPTSGQYLGHDGNQWTNRTFSGGGVGVGTGRTISAGTGLTGGGDLSANRSISLDTSYTDGRYVRQSAPGVQVITGPIELRGPENEDTDLLRIGDRASGYGFWWRYAGSGTGASNLLELWADNQNSGSPIRALAVNQSGVITVGGSVSDFYFTGNGVSLGTLLNQKLGVGDPITSLSAGALNGLLYGAGGTISAVTHSTGVLRGMPGGAITFTDDVSDLKVVTRSGSQPPPLEGRLWVQTGVQGTPLFVGTGSGWSPITAVPILEPLLVSGDGIEISPAGYDGTQVTTITLDIGTGSGQVARGNHNHDSRYYTQGAADSRFLRKDTSDTMAGNLTVQGTVSATGGFFDTSDEALKRDIRSLGTVYDPRALLGALEPVAFRWRATGLEDVGHIAQRVPVPFRGPGGKTIAYHRITTTLVAGWQLHEAEIDALRREVAALRKEVRHGVE